MTQLTFLASSLTFLAATAFAGCATGDGADGADEADGTDSASLAADATELAKEATKPFCVTSPVVLGATAAAIAAAAVDDAAAPSCFETFSDAVFAATNGRVKLPPAITDETATDDDLNGGDVKPGDTVIIAAEFRNAHFKPLHHGLLVPSTVRCDNPRFIAAAIPRLPPAWNNDISSARTFTGCTHSVHFDFRKLQGPHADCHTGCAQIGKDNNGRSMNDRTTSIFWTR